MHLEARDFTLFIKQILPEYFSNKCVLDVGSGDINGNNRFLFENCIYSGNDVIEAENVTIVSKTKDLQFQDEYFDVIISTECFEHDAEYNLSLNNIIRMLKKDGLFFFTCASLGRAEHGTLRTNPYESYSSIGHIKDFMNYYKNLDINDINNSIDLKQNFSSYRSYYNKKSYDLYFVGIKKGEKIINIKSYDDKYVIETTNDLKKNELSIIFDKYNTDKNSYFHNYTRQYIDIVEKYKNDRINLLELGVYNGGSLKAWKEYFNKANHIVGIDINSNCKIYESYNIYVEIGNSTNNEFLKNVNDKYGNFDIIIDDCSHTNEDVIKSFEYLFPLLNDNGIYIIEDTICYKSNNYINKNYPNHLSYFCNFLPYLNQWRFDSTYGIKDHCIDPYKIIKKTNNIFEASIDKIEFGCSYIVIYKKIRYHWI